MLQEKCDEWHQNAWVAAIAFKTAFDSVSHESIWQALSEQGVPSGYIELLQQPPFARSATVDDFPVSVALKRVIR